MNTPAQQKYSLFFTIIIGLAVHYSNAMAPKILAAERYIERRQMIQNNQAWLLWAIEANRYDCVEAVLFYIPCLAEQPLQHPEYLLITPLELALKVQQKSFNSFDQSDYEHGPIIAMIKSCIEHGIYHRDMMEKRNKNGTVLLDQHGIPRFFETQATTGSVRWDKKEKAYRSLTTDYKINTLKRIAEQL